MLRGVEAERETSSKSSILLYTFAFFLNLNAIESKIEGEDEKEGSGEVPAI